MSIGYTEVRGDYIIFMDDDEPADSESRFTGTD